MFLMGERNNKAFISNLIVFVFFESFTHAAVPDGESFKYIAKPWALNGNPSFPFKYAHIEDYVFISCQTNDPKAQVSLLTRKSSSEPYENAKEKLLDNQQKTRLHENGQNFTIKDAKTIDAGQYQCDATSDNGINKQLTLGNLFIRREKRDIDPELFPTAEKQLIESDENYNISCKAIGQGLKKESYLKWYKRDDNGNDIEIESTKVSKKEEVTSDGRYIDVEILMFKNFQPSDIGTYVCKRKNREKTVQVDLRSDEVPTITLPESKNSIQLEEGSQLKLACSVTGSPKPSKYWMKDNEIIFKCTNKFDENCRYSIAKAQHPENTGVYTCVAENKVGIAKQNVTVDVVEKPVLDKTKSKVIANDKTIMDVECKIKDGNPLPRFTWKYKLDKEGLPWIPWEKKQYPGKDVETNISYIAVPPSEDTYKVKCFVENSLGMDSFEFKLIRNAQEEPQFTIDVKIGSNYLCKSNSNLEDLCEINEDDPFEVLCKSDKRIYDNLLLEKDGVALKTNETDRNNKDERVYVVEYATLSQSGLYQCKANLKKLSFIMERSRNISIKKLERPLIIGFNHLTLNQDIVKNTNITCRVSGNPKPEIEWKFDDKPLIAERLENINKCNITNVGTYVKQNGRDDELILCGLNFQEHQGKYTCTAENKLGKRVASRTLTVLASPKIKAPSSVTLTPTDSKLSCDTYANPIANVTLYKYEENNKTITVASGMKNATKFFSDIKENDGGYYICIASNTLGQSSLRMSVIVRGLGLLTAQEKQKKIVIGVIIGALLILLFMIIFVVLYRRHLKEKYALYLEPDDTFTLDPDRSLFEQCSELPYDTTWEFPREKLTFIKTLGSGAFGQVWLAEGEGIHSFNPRDKSAAASKRRKSFLKSKRYHSLSMRYKKHVPDNVQMEKTMVAVKTLKEDAAETEYKDLASELKILIHLGEHKNIVNLLGACTRGGKLCVILECCPHGNLLNFLRSQRDIFQPLWFKEETDMQNEFTYIDLLLIAYQVAKGMDFLQSKRCIHRDLAARNVLVGDDFVMKIADFGLARDIYKDEFYLKETTGLLPVKWMAPESLFDKVYTSSSDVWSFGILLWEVFTLGGSPYPGLPTEELFAYLEDGRRMSAPEICPKGVYEIMKDCWAKSPYDRPLFAHLVEVISNVMKQNVPKSDDYLDEVDFVCNTADDYLIPASPPRRADSAEYLEADTNPKFSPKGETFVPPPRNGSINYDDDMIDSPLPNAPLIPKDDYVPMTPADHYKEAPTFHFGQEAVV